MKEVTNLTVKYHDRIVGTLAETRDGRGAFQYADEWLAHGFAISPFSLPLEDKVFVPGGYELEGLFGVFADSLPDGWGRLETSHRIPNLDYTDLMKLTAILTKD